MPSAPAEWGPSHPLAPRGVVSTPTERWQGHTPRSGGGTIPTTQSHSASGCEGLVPHRPDKYGSYEPSRSCPCLFDTTVGYILLPARATDLQSAAALGR